jgi:hypothetical protein
MSWKLGGSHFETCSCYVVCPCTASLALGAGDAVDFEIEDVVPLGVETGQPVRLTGVFHPAGSELTVAKATRSKIDAFGIQYEGRAGFSTSHFSWAA